VPSTVQSECDTDIRTASALQRPLHHARETIKPEARSSRDACGKVELGGGDRVEALQNPNIDFQCFLTIQNLLPVSYLTVSRYVCEVSGYGDFDEDLKRWYVGALATVARSALV
jgi:hypothetical protein